MTNATALQNNTTVAETLIINDATLVLKDRVIPGSVKIIDNVIAGIFPEQYEISDYAPEDDCTVLNFNGDYLLPGLVELHTDHLETHYMPRAGVRWNPVAAIQSHDAQIASSGITTVVDCLRMGSDESAKFEKGEMRELADILEQASIEGRLRAEHFLHLRCEVSSPDVLEEYALFEDNSRVKLVSLMDHAPGQRQFTDISVYEKYYRNKENMDDATFQKFMSDRIEQSERYANHHREVISTHCRSANIKMASHDDAVSDHIDEALSLGVSISEFPTTLDAATAAKSHGLKILMGAPNIIRGKSHSGNVSAAELAENGLIDILSSDYVPASLIHAVFMLAFDLKSFTLPEALALVTLNPAAAAGFNDRGVLETNHRADLVRVKYKDGIPIVKTVWREGTRVI